MSSEVMETLLRVCVSKCEYFSLRYRMVLLDKVSDEISIIQYEDIMTDHLRVLDLPGAQHSTFKQSAKTTGLPLNGLQREKNRHFVPTRKLEKDFCMSCS